MREVRQLTITCLLTLRPRYQQPPLDLDVRQEATEDLESRPAQCRIREATGPQERAEAALELLHRPDLEGLVRDSSRAAELEP